MEKQGQWHVFVDDETGKRSCFYGFWDALAFNEIGEIAPMCHGKKEIPLEEWTGAELCWMMSGILKEAKLGRLSNLPNVILRAMEKCGVEEERKLDVMRSVFKEISRMGKGR